jgi:MoaA/NifB/PqqE/SkfB family radical SAM enzyme
MPRISAPVRVSIDLTYICDLRCIHCRTNTGEVPFRILKHMMSVDTIIQTVRDLDEMKTFEITFTGGEPTIHPQFWDIVEGIGKLKFASITLITNAATLTTERVDRLAAAGIQSVRVSVDGTRAKFREIRKKDLFERVVQNIGLLRKRIPNLKILTTVMTANFDNVFDLAEFAVEAGFRRQDLILVRAHGRGGRNGLTLSEGQVRETERRTLEFQARIHPDVLDLNLNAPYLSPDPPERMMWDVVMYPYLVKDASLAISATGDVTMSRLYSPKPIGNVKFDRIGRVWETAQDDLATESEQFDIDRLREIFWNFQADESAEATELFPLLDRQIFDGAEVI